MKKLLLIVLTALSLQASAQYTSTLPTGYTPFATQMYYKITGSDTTFIEGASGKGYHIIAANQAVKDSLAKYIPLTRSLTINGTAQDLSANRTFNITTANINGLQDSLTKKANRTFDNVAAGAISQVKVSGLVSDLALKAPLASPIFTGTLMVSGTTISNNYIGLSTGALASNALGVNYIYSGLNSFAVTNNAGATSLLAIENATGNTNILGTVTAPTFFGALTGNASTATNVALGGITGLGTGNATALAINVGTAGSFITNTAASAAYAPIAGTMYIGTTAHALNRASAAEGLAGITSLTPGANFSLSQNAVNAFTSEETGAIVNTLYLKAGNIGMGTANPLNLVSIRKSTNSGSGTIFPRLSISNTLATQGNGSTTFNFSDMEISSGDGLVTMFLTSSFASGTWEPQGILNVATNHPLSFRTNNIERMRISNIGDLTLSSMSVSGNVIVGANNAGTLSKITIGSGLSLSAGTLTATGGSAGTVTGSGTAGKITVWNSASDIGNSPVTVTGSNISVTGTITGSNLSGTNTGDQTTITGNAGTATLAANSTLWGGAAYAGPYLQLTGGTLSGALNGTSGLFSGNLVANNGTSTQITISNSGTFRDKDNFDRIWFETTGAYRTILDIRTGSYTAFRNSAGAEVAIINDTGAASFGGALTAASATFSGNISALNLSGTNTGDQTTITGNAGTATALQTARTISGTSFDGTANITLNNTGITNGAGYITSSTLALAGDVTSAGSVTTIAANAVTNAKSAQMLTKTYKGRTSALTGNAEDVPVATLKTDLGLVKADVGLGSVDNTSDVSKPVSTATQTALDLKANLTSPALTGTPTAPTATAGTSTTQVATTAFVNAAVSAGTSGTYTPIITGRQNVFSITPRLTHYIKVGTQVYVQGRVEVTASGAGPTVITIDYPTSPAVSMTLDDTSGFGRLNGGSNVAITHNATYNSANLSYDANNITAYSIFYNFTYTAL